MTPWAAAAPLGTARRHAPGLAVAAFLLLAVVQNQDVLFANALLGADEAGRFAVLSTLGGVAAFATTTVPLMLLPRAGRDALRAALIVAAALGVGAVAVVAISPGTLVGTVFGSRYAPIGSLAVPYVLAMALLGVARVLVAHACAGARARRAVMLLAPVVVLHAGLLLAIGDDAAGVATATLVSTATLTAGAAALTIPRIAVSREVIAVAAIALGGLALRLIATRGIWLDEAISIHQAQMPLGDMLTNLRTTDVHPPLHHILLWGTVRLLGDSEIAVRVPSLIAATAMIPVLYAAARDIYDERAGYAAATLAAVAPFAVWYADEARMYALFMLFALLSLWMQIRVIRGAGTASWLGFVASAAALVYTQYFGLLFVATQMLGFAVAVARGVLPLRRVLAWTALLALVLAPLAPFAHEQFAANEASGKGFQQPTQTGGGTIDPQARPGAYAALTNFAWAVLGYHSDGTMTALAALWPLGVLLALALLGRGRSWTTLLVVACGLLPAIGAVRPRPAQAVRVRGAVLHRHRPAGAAADRPRPDELAAPAGGDRPGDGGGRGHARPRPRRPAAQRLQPARVRLQDGRARHRGASQAGRRDRVHAVLPRPRGRVLRARGPEAEADGPGPARAAPRPEGLRPRQLPGQAAVPRGGP